MLPFEPRERFAEMLAAADVCLVTQNRQSHGFSLPSKIFNFMASGRPILAVTPPKSEIANLVNRGQCGVNVPTGHPPLLASVILGLQKKPERLQEMGANARALLLAEFSRQHCIDGYERVLLDAGQAARTTHVMRASQ
jgi:glycosyltransferase involved in cell wall biosynthesis